MVYQDKQLTPSVVELQRAIEYLFDHGQPRDGQMKIFPGLEVRPALTPAGMVMIAAYGDDNRETLPLWAQELRVRGYNVEHGHEFDFPRDSENPSDRKQNMQTGRFYLVWR